MFQVDISTLNSQYEPKDKLELRVSTGGESVVAFSALDTALYNLRSNDKDPLKKVKQQTCSKRSCIVLLYRSCAFECVFLEEMTMRTYG